MLVERGADDLEVAQQPGLEQVQQPGQQLALARSPVAPKRTTVMGGVGILPSLTSPSPVREGWRTSAAPWGAVVASNRPLS